MKNIVVRKSEYTENTFNTYENHKRAVLLGQLCLLVAIISVLYVLLDSSQQRFDSVPYYLITALICSVVFLINRLGYFKFASTIFLSVMIFLLYIFTDSDDNKLGTHMFLVVYALVAITLYGYESIAWGIFFLCLAIVCFFASYFLVLPRIIQAPPFTEALKQTYFIANFLIVISLTSLLVFFLIAINHKANRAIWNKSQQLTKANNELDRFVYSASHDLKAPLNSLTGLVALCKHSQDMTEVKSYLNMMMQSIANLDLFIHEIIDFSRNAKTEIYKETFNVLRLMEEVVNSLKFSYGFEKVQIKYSIESDLSATSDPSRLRVILHNIIGNAMKYHNPNQTDPWIKLTCNKESTKLIIEIEDNGIGIEDEYKSKIFDMFFRATDKLKGSGLGLYIVKETIEKLEGKIELSSQQGKGSVFRIELPLLS